MDFTMMPSIDWNTLEEAFKKEYGYTPNVTDIISEPNEGYNIFDVDILEDEDVPEVIEQMWSLIHKFTHFDTILIYMSF